jgi:hypothetical protein
VPSVAATEIVVESLISSGFKGLAATGAQDPIGGEDPIADTDAWTCGMVRAAAASTG